MVSTLATRMLRLNSSGICTLETGGTIRLLTCDILPRLDQKGLGMRRAGFQTKNGGCVAAIQPHNPEMTNST